MRLALRASAFLWAGAMLSWLTHTDQRILLYLATNPTAQGLRPFGEWFSAWGLFLFYLPFLAMLVLGTQKRHDQFRTLGHAYLLAQVFGTMLLVHLIKLVSARPRPLSEHVQDAAFHIPRFTEAFHSSFPSSHAVDAMVGAAFVAVLWRGRITPILALAAALLMGVSRILIGKHYVSDVLAGLALGMGIVGVAMHVCLLPRWQRINTGQNA